MKITLVITEQDSDKIAHAISIGLQMARLDFGKMPLDITVKVLSNKWKFKVALDSGCHCDWKNEFSPCSHFNLT